MTSLAVDGGEGDVRVSVVVGRVNGSLRGCCV